MNKVIRSRICDAFNHIKRKCIKNYLPIEEEWIAREIGFINFIIYILPQYKKATKKWRNYKYVTNRMDQKKTNRPRNNSIWISLKYKEKGLTKRNIQITCPTETQKTRINTHKIMFENKLLSTRDIQNILKKRGIFISLMSITKRIRKQQKILVIRNKEKILYQKQYRSTCEIERMNNIHIGTLKGYLRRHTMKEASIFYKLK